MEKLINLTKYLNQIFENPPASVDKYEDYYYELSQKLNDIDEEFDIELITDENLQPKAVFDQEKNLLQVFVNPQDDFQYFIYEVIEDFLENEEEVSKALEYFIKMVEEGEIDFVAKKIIAASQKEELSEEEERIISGAQEYLMQMLEYFSGIDDEEKEFDILYSIKTVNSLLRFADADWEDLKLFELQYDYRVLNILRMSEFLRDGLPGSQQEYVEEAKNIIKQTLEDIEDFQPDKSISNLSYEEMAKRIIQLDYFDILQWINYFIKNGEEDKATALFKAIMDQINVSLENNEWEDAFVLTNILKPYFIDNEDLIKNRVLAQLGLNLYYDAYKDYKTLNVDFDDHIMQFIRKEFSNLGLK